ncbi:hypothetical protein [Salipiger abyssi]|uniref:hypothetical protein n=1 Tax=Salipiger abyssi TaxID=1250539 RepID=UPI00405811DB
MNQTIDIKVQADLCLKSLEAILPFADSAGIATSYEDAYDEWEEIVQTLYASFVLRPLCDSGIIWDVKQFRRLGFEADSGARGEILVDLASQTYFIFDIAKFGGNQMRLVLRPRDHIAQDTLARIEDCESFRVEFLPLP